MKNRKLIVLVEEINLMSGLRLFFLAIFNHVVSIRYLSCDWRWEKLVNVVRSVKICCDIGKCRFDLTQQTSMGGCIWDWVQLMDQVTADQVIKRLLAGGTFLNYLPAGIELERQEAFLRKLVQVEIYNAIMLALAYNNIERPCNNEANVVVLAKVSDLGGVLQEALPNSLKVDILGYSDVRSLLPIKIVWFLALQVNFIVGRIYENLFLSHQKNQEKPLTVGVQYAHGVDGPGPETNVLWWYSKSRLTSNRCLVFFDHLRFPATDQDIRHLKEGGYRYRILVSKANSTSKSPTQGFHGQSTQRIAANLSLLLNVIAKAPRIIAPIWQISRWLSVLVNVRRWQSVMENENIKILFSVEETGLDTMSLAADLVGAIRIGYHWSNLYPVNARLVPLHQVYFVWGSRHQSIVGKSLGGCSEVVLQSGCIFDNRESVEAFGDSVAELRQQLHASGVRHIIGVLDMSLGEASYYGADRHIEFYNCMLTWAESNCNIGLLIKPKSHGRPLAFDYAPDLSARFEILTKEGRAVLLEGKRSVVEAAMACEVVVALGYNSGGVVAALKGTRTVFWDPAQLEGGPLGPSFQQVNWGNPTFVFPTLDQLTQSLQHFLKSPSTLPNLGDFSPVLDMIDAFRDGDAALRIGSFVRCFLEAIERRADRSTALDEAVKEYQSKWGKDKVFLREDRNV